MYKSESFNRSRRGVLAAGGAAILVAALRPWSVLAQAGGAAKLRIGVVGAGRIGGTVGALWVKAGHPVLFSSRHPHELKDLVAGLGPLASAGTVAQAIAFGDVLFIAVPYGALPQLGRDYGGAFANKIALDACNAFAGRDGSVADEVARNGVGVTSQKYLPGTRLVRAFNTLSWRILGDEANRPDPKLAIPIAGDDAEAVRVAADLVHAAGFEPVVVGKLADARRFQHGAEGYGQAVSAAELRRKLALAP